MSRLLRAITANLMALMFSAAAAAHEIRPAYLEIHEDASQQVRILWKQPVVGDVALPLRPVLSSRWLDAKQATSIYTDTYLTRRWSVMAPHAPIQGQRLTIEGLQRSLTDVLVRVTYRDGVESLHLVSPDAPTLILPSSSTSTPPIAHYLALGIEHIWTGIDHLLFVLGLMLLVAGFKDLLKTITAFTIAHSITLGVAALGLFEVPPAPVEAVIALSIVYLAVELVLSRQGRPGVAHRFPWLVALAFGLLHGFGFAGALSEIGLPADRIPSALLLFNVGIELGQIAFVCGVLAVLRALSFALPQASSRLQGALPHVIGSLAAFWFIERTLAALSL